MTINLTIDGKSYPAETGENLAALMLRHGLVPFRRHPVDQTERAPHCMMGICFECLVEVDGTPSIQACLTSAREGMSVKRNLSND